MRAEQEDVAVHVADHEPRYQWTERLIRRDDLTPAAKMVAIALRGRLGGKDHCWPSIQTIQADTNLSRNAVLAGVRQLEQCGVITVKRRGRGRGNVYRFENCTGLENEPVQKLDLTGSKNRLQPVQKKDPNLLRNQSRKTKRDFDEQARLVLTAYAEIKPPALDQSRGRAKGHIARLLVKHPVDRLLRAVENYRLATEIAATEPQYRRGAGNFFGRDGDWETYGDPEWTPPEQPFDDEPPELDRQVIEDMERRATGGGQWR
ncbi:MAG: helix-turn-helix domain-containing protein [Phycisphaerae bacterium]|nr:helix-turn-helix domain-containing protein [Phycisphaerae bacterium]